MKWCYRLSIFAFNGNDIADYFSRFKCCVSIFLDKKAHIRDADRYDGTAGNDYLDASTEGTKDIAVFRAAAGNDTCIGGAGNDRFDGGAGADSMFGGGGNDQFFIARDNATGGARDSIDGGTGTDR